MALTPGKHVINIGSAPNDSNGDTIRDGGEKINHMFDEIYSALGNGLTINFASGTTLSQILDVSQNLASYVANTDMLMTKMDNVYGKLGDGVNLSFNVHTYHTESQVLENKDISSANNKITLYFDEVANVNVTSAVNDDYLVYDAANTEWIAKTPDTFQIKGTVSGNLVPDITATYDLGSLTNTFKNLYLSNNIHIGSESIYINSSGEIEFSAPISASTITSTSVVTSVLTTNTNSVYCTAIGGYDDDETFDNTTSSWLYFPFDKIEVDNLNGFDPVLFWYVVPLAGTYRVDLAMLAPATVGGAEFRLCTQNSITSAITTYNQGWIFVNDSEQNKTYFCEDLNIGDKIYCEYLGKFYQRSQMSINRL